MKTRILLFSTLFLSLIAQNISAQTTEKAIQTDIQIRQQQRQQQQDLERTRELQEINRIKEKSQDLDLEVSQKDFIDDGNCRKIDQINVVGNNSLKVKKIVNPYAGKCLTKTDLKNIKSAIENHYVDSGYMLARVYFGTEKIAAGIIEIVIEEGRAGEIQIIDNSKINSFAPWRRSLQKFFAFGSYDDKVINLRDIEQGLDQINRLSSNGAKMEIKPSSKDGYSDIVINNQIRNISKPSIAINNAGNESTGRIREVFSLDQDNLLGVNDNIYISHTRSDYNGIDKRYFKSNYIAASVPFTYYTFGASYAGSDYSSATRTSNSTSVSSGSGNSYSYYISRVLVRGKQYKTSTKAELINATNKNYLNGSFISTNSRELAVLKLSFDNIIYSKLGTIFLQPKYNRGTKLMGAVQDQKNLNADTQRAQFNAYGLYGSVSNNFSLPKTNINLFHNLSFDSQYSEERLLSSEQIAVGGRYSVRGFEESVMSGDDGYYIKNDFTVSTFQIAPKIIQESFAGSVLQRLNIGTFYDYGYVRNKIVNDDTDEGYMSGTGAKLSYNGEYFRADLTYSRGLHSPQFLRNLNQISKDDESIYFDVKVGLF